MSIFGGMMSQQYSIAEARNRFTSLVHTAERNTLVELTRHGKPVAVLMSIEHFRKLSEAKIGFWQAYEGFNTSYAPNLRDLTDDSFSNLRDTTPGREVDL